MSMTKAELDQLTAGIERILAEAEAAQQPAQVVVIRGPGPGPRGPKATAEPSPARWQYSCPYCKAHGDFLPLHHEPTCHYA